MSGGFFPGTSGFMPEGAYLPTAGGSLTGPLKLPDGAVGAPALSFTNFATTGLYAGAGPVLAVTVGGVSIGRWQGTGYVQLSGSIYVDSVSPTGGSSAALAMAGRIRLSEVAEPANAPANAGDLFVKDNGSGKSQLCVRFASGATQVIATEP